MTSQKYRMTYSKVFPAIYLAHLDSMNSLIRAIRRSGLPYLVTQGFHPRIKCSYGPALPLGFHGKSEFFDFYLSDDMPEDEVSSALSKQFPIGFSLEKVRKFTSEAFPDGNDFKVIIRIYCNSSSAEVNRMILSFFTDPNLKIDLPPGSTPEYFVPSESVSCFSVSDNSVVSITANENENEKSISALENPSLSKYNQVIYTFRPINSAGKSISPSKTVNALAAYLGDGKFSITKIERELV
ncbi:MAG: DUF2344 domain-containing protein [Candidatus Riflebacteria bacterium]|nr:DUF2344 domain-containing protein [Candidatus Riflebacteria bacterium]